LSLKKKVGAVASAAVIAGTVAFLKPWEGLMTKPYRDIVGVVTWCYGETQGEAKTSYSPKECSDLLAARIQDYYGPISACWGPEVEARMTDNMRIAFTSSAYNFGTGAFCKSSMVRLLKDGEFRAACDALMLYVRAGGRVIRGLVNRRSAERKLCLQGL
jgi:lysozyme